jgi:hypothetical protein
MTYWPVNTQVGNVKNNDPGLVEPVALARPRSPMQCPWVDHRTFIEILGEAGVTGIALRSTRREGQVRN